MRLQPFTEADYDTWFDGQIESYAAARASAGVEPLADARRTATRQFAELLPDGLATRDHDLFTLWDDQEEVGTIWFARRRRSDGESWFGYGFEIRENQRRRGLGRAAIEAVEAVAREQGIVALELNVFGDNIPARSLYEQLGFVPTAITMRKVL